MAAVEVGDGPDLWRSIGFSVENDQASIGGVAHVLTGIGGGVRAWALEGSSVDIAGLASFDPPAPSGDDRHDNGVIALDHLVVSSPDLGRTIEELEASGVELRRIRSVGSSSQAFFKLGDVVLELVGRQSGGSGAPSFWGLAFTVADLDATSRYLGDRLRPAKDAVQKGRRIATLDRTVGSSVPIAFMSREPRSSG